MDIYSLKDLLKDSIEGSMFAAQRKELVARCPYCGHTSSAGKKHLYISVQEDKPIMYNCFKCNERGIVDQEILMKLGVRDINTIKEVNIYNQEVRENSDRSTYTKKRDVSSINYNKLYDNFMQSGNKLPNEIIQKKLDYLNGRLGLNYPIQRYIDSRIVFDLSNDAIYYKIRKYKRMTDDDFVILNNEYIGFITADQSGIVLRHIYDNELPRYIIINMSGNDEMVKSYTIPCSLSIPTGPIKIHLSEGQFDILSIFFNVCNQEPGIYLATSGSNYISAIQYLASRYGLFNIEWHFYFDNDDAGTISKEVTKNYIKRHGFYFTGDVYFHSNNKKKDFGVPLSDIDEEYELF